MKKKGLGRKWQKSSNVDLCEVCGELHVMDKEYNICIECWHKGEIAITSRQSGK